MPHPLKYLGPVIVLLIAVTGLAPLWLAIPAALVIGLRLGVDLERRRVRKA